MLDAGDADTLPRESLVLLLLDVRARFSAAPPLVLVAGDNGTAPTSGSSSSPSIAFSYGVSKPPMGPPDGTKLLLNAAPATDVEAVEILAAPMPANPLLPYDVEVVPLALALLECHCGLSQNMTSSSSEVPSSEYESKSPNIDGLLPKELPGRAPLLLVTLWRERGEMWKIDVESNIEEEEAVDEGVMLPLLVRSS
jgi:hypothetical protein